ncbi:MAG: TetR/AcrR family transcriptional regulator [Clostridiales Family XIII bacterium]|nr:TetR/AcrR family transcriptional regulator [Clostridiales Family XIII bacterium]
MAGPDTKEKILEVSIELFNTEMATNVSTIQIAHALDMSVGNLYYHYRNKEHIIREIYRDRIAAEIDALVMNKDDRLSESGIIRYFNGLAQLIYKYRFFYTEMYALVRNDPDLHVIFHKRARAVARVLAEQVGTWIAVGIMRPASEGGIEALSEICWMHVTGWMSYRMLAEEGAGPQALARDSFRSIFHILRPYFTDTANERFGKLLEFMEFE